jgi:hypothetical protein
VTLNTIFSVVLPLTWLNSPTPQKEPHPLEEIVSKSTLLCSDRTQENAYTNQFGWHPEGTRGVPMEGAFFGCESRWPSRKEG